MYFLLLLCRQKRWDEHLHRPSLDYSEIFDEDVGQIPGSCRVSLFVVFSGGSFPKGGHWITSSHLAEETEALNRKILVGG